MKSHSVLGIDLGTSSVKALVVNRDDGRTVGDASAAYAIDRPEPGAAEQSPETWWRATVEAVRQALLQAGHPPIDAIGISGQMHGTVALDESLRPLGAAVIWADQRSAEDAASIEGVLGASLLERAGSRAAVGFQAATLRCLARTQPDRFEAIRMVLPPKDFLRLTMTGEIATDPSDAAGTLLFDLHTRAWSAELAAAAGIDLACLPPIVPSGAISGHLTPDAAHALGLLPCIPVAGGAADAPAAALGVGVIAPDSLLVTFSSGAQVYTPLASPVIDRTGRTHTFASPLDPATMAGWYGMGATLNAGNAVHWFQSLFSETDAARVAEMAESVPPGANGLLFLPYLAGERTPYFDADARGAFIGFNPTHGRPELARAVLEGIGFALLDAWEALRESTGSSPHEIVLAGGGARSPVWRQIIADQFGLPVRTVQGSEHSAMGAAMLAAAATGDDLRDLVHRWVRHDATVQPQPEAATRYEQLHELFRDAWQANRDLAHRLAKWGKTGI